jgi:predicted protein tyrosine phosphatase
MMFKILSVLEARDIVKQYPNKLNVISVEKTETVDPNLCKNHIHLKMDDVDDAVINKWDNQLKQKGTKYPEKQHVLDAIEFDKKHTVDMIHCHAGISRSTAIGYAILRSRGMNKPDAMKMVHEIQPYAMPNRRLVRFVDEIYGNK